MPGGAKSRENAKLETRRALVAAALEEFVAHGLDVPSLDAICERAGYTRGAFYVHFRDRDELVAAAMEVALGRFLNAVLAHGQSENDLATTVGQFVALIFREGRFANDAVADWDLALSQLLEASRRSDKVRERFAALLVGAAQRVASITESGQETAAVRGDVASEDLGWLLVLLALGATVAVDVELPLDRERLSRAVLHLLQSAG